MIYLHENLNECCIPKKVSYQNKSQSVVLVHVFEEKV